MLIDSLGLPQDEGATDKMDSARLAGMMAIVNHPLTPDLTSYVIGNLAVRHPQEVPSNNPLNFTRDQLMCLVAGLRKQGHLEACRALYEAAKTRGWFAQNSEADHPGTVKKFPNGRDYLSPSNRMVLAICAGHKGNIIGYAWLAMDLAYNAIITPTREPNQLLAQLSVVSPKWTKAYKLMTPKWREAIRGYWSGWRKEPALAEILVTHFEGV
jgi:hypothetical protein